jgi:hypothetical protein
MSVNLPPLFRALTAADEHLAEVERLRTENRELRDTVVDLEVSRDELARENRDMQSQIKRLSGTPRGWGQK